MNLTDAMRTPAALNAAGRMMDDLRTFAIIESNTEGLTTSAKSGAMALFFGTMLLALSDVLGTATRVILDTALEVAEREEAELGAAHEPAE